MKIVTVLGARPQFVKAATVSRELKKEGIQEVLVHTGQHFDHNMSEVFFEEMDIRRPDHHLDISGLLHGAMTGRMIEQVEKILESEKPDQVLVYGDTNSTLAGALAGVKMHIPVVHVEAGLRSFDMNMPEEINRILTDRVSSLLFCPTQTAVDNLIKEGYEHFPSRIIQCGDVMYDAVLYYKSKIATHAQVIRRLDLAGKPFALVTVHRAENTDNPARLRQICEGINEIGREMTVVVPLHPRTRGLLQAHGLELKATVIEPVGYFDSLALLEGCNLVLTDSGGLQKEAYFFGKYCITLRDQTEWVELVNSGMNSLAGADAGKIIELFKQRHLINPSSLPLYGDGHASAIIAQELKK